MNNKIITLTIALCASTALPLSAQTITFEANDYKSVGIYDSWADSPFRNGTLEGNAQVIDNFLNDVSDELGYAPNTTSKIAAMQRSRYGSNLMGIRVDLNEPFRLTKEARYVHVLINRPLSDGKVMLITLGKRSDADWAWQSEDVEQTWSLSSTSVGKDGWQDAVFAIKGFSYDDQEQDGIDIYSLVVCPDVTDRSSLAEDFVCYIDEIEIDDNATARFNASYYPLNFDPTATYTRTDRYLSSVSLSGTDVGTQSYSGLNSLVYNDGTKVPVVFTASPGDKVQPLFAYTGTFMDGYVYVDWGQDGHFSADVNSDGKPADGTDLVTYDAYMIDNVWHNSEGVTEENGNRIQSGVPAFTIPEDTKPGLYRMRYKVDWNSIDAGGNTNENNLLINNGGAVADVMLNIHGTQSTVTASQLNGDVVLADAPETPLQDYVVPYGKDLRIKVVPAPDFTYTGILVRYGYNLAGDSLVRDNPQHFVTYYCKAEFEDDELTLPASVFAFPEVEIEGYMVSERYLELNDNEVTDHFIGGLTITGERERSYEIVDNTHSLQDLRDEKWVPVWVGKTLSCSLDGDLYVDVDRDGNFSLVSEKIDGSIPSAMKSGIYDAVFNGETYQIRFLANIAPQATTVGVASDNGRIICYQSHTDLDSPMTLNTSTGVPESVASFYFLGFNAQPLVDGYACTTATIRRGYNIDGEQVLGGIKQWSEYEVDLPEGGQIKLAQDSVWGEVRVTADFEPTGTSPYQFAFSDEFDDEEIDDNKWAIRQRANATWNRFISDDPRTAFLQDGSLVCRAFANDDMEADNVAMLTGMRQTSNSYGLLHGYVEVRAITTPHSGNFPAIWMMPMDQSDGWPTCGEIDIWEQINTENRSYHTVHSYWGNTLGQSNNPPKTTNCSYNMAGEWHTYGLLKEADLLTWFVDGTKVFTYAKGDADMVPQMQLPFDNEFYLILNQSVGDGSWANNYDSSFTYETRFDWARFYSLKEETGVASPAANERRDDGRTYDLSGRLVSRPTHGVYIKGNKKAVY